MKLHPRRIALACACAAGLAQAAAPVEQPLADGQVAALSYFHLNANDCERLSIEVVASAERARGARPRVALLLLARNSCSGESARFAGSAPAARLHIDPGLGSAALRASVEIADAAGRRRSVDLDLIWSGGTRLPAGADAVPLDMPDLRATFSRFEAVHGGAAVGGTLRLDGIDLLAPGTAPELAIIGGALARGRDARYAVAPRH